MVTKPTLSALAALGLVATALAACDHAKPAPVEPHVACLQRNPDRNLYFGDLHVHTGYSFDASAFDVRTTPADAYRFARGEAVSLPPFDGTGGGGRSLRLDRPLDFVAVTDHSEYLAEVETCTTPGSVGYDSSSCQVFRAGGNDAVVQFAFHFTFPEPARHADLCADGCPTTVGAVWQRIQQAAADAYDQTNECRFTSFVAYEYTAATGVATLHRNVIFRNSRVPQPITYFEQPTPQKLWRELETQCLDRGDGCDVLAIPHNPNESNGNMFTIEATGDLDEDRRRATARVAMEPLVEIYQHKAASECMNGLSGVLGAPDEQCEFERPRRPEITDCGDGVGGGGATRRGCFSRMDFVRNVLGYGLKERQRLGVNPFRLGIIASTDTHNGTPGAVAEQDFIGHRGLDDDTAALRLGGGSLTPGGIEFSAGGLTAVWAEENTRDAIFDALRRREVYGTSGPRMAVRMFGGWQLDQAACANADMVKNLYQAGVPMGGVLPARKSDAPRFAISALRDAGTAQRPGVPLQRIQMVKGWLDGTTPRMQVFDVAGDANNGATVDEATCQPQGTGADRLCAVWQDPSFDPSTPAFYYVRVLENPTCRWSTYTCNALPPADRPPACSDPDIPKTVQERAWTSPIWYEP